MVDSARVNALLDSAMNEVLHLMSVTDGLETIFDNKGVKGYSIYSEESSIVKAVGIIEHSVDAIANFIWDPNTRKNWDKMTVEVKVVAELDPKTRILYDVSELPWPISNRDFLYATRIVDRDDGKVIICKSTELASHPERDGFIRANINIGGYYLKSLGRNRTEMTYIISADPKGMIPKFVVNKSGEKKAKTILKIRKALG